MLASISLKAQNKLSYQEVERQTLAYYYNAQWDSIIMKGEAAIDNNIDYYYLNYRLAVAYFFKENYFTSTYYFDRAIKQNKGAMKDSYFKELYYRALLYTKQNATAFRITGALDPLDDLTEINYRGELDISAFYGSTPELIQQEDLRMDEDYVFSQTSYQQAISFINIGSIFMINEFIELDVRYSNAQIDMITAVENRDIFHIRNFELKQNTFYVKPRFNFNRKQRLDFLAAVSSSSGRPYGQIDSNELNVNYYNYKSTSFVFGLDYSYLNNKTRLGFNASFSTFGFKQQLQVGASLEWFPLGTYDLYSLTQINAFSSEPGDIRPVIRQKIGAKITSRLWIEVLGIYGDVQNVTMVSDNFSYEIPNHTYGIASAQLIGVVSPRVNIFVGVQYWWKYTEQKQDDREHQETITIIDYQQFNIIGGLQWKF